MVEGGGSHFRKVITVIAVTYLLHVNAATDNQRVINEINKLENMMKTIQTPPELIESVLKQVEAHCPNKKQAIDQAYLTNASKCVEQHINVTKVADDMKAAVPEGKMDNVFRDLCFKWPKVKNCMNDFFTIIDECWQKGDKVSTFVDEVVRFFCGNDNEGERIAIFFAEGGLECMETHGDDVSKCVQDKKDLVGLDQKSLTNLDELDINEIANQNFKVPKADEICKSIKEMHECASVELRKCKDPTSENLVSSMLVQVGKALECKTSEFQLRQTSSDSTSTGATVGRTVALGSFIIATTTTTTLVALFAF